jgi:hypothetical protein
MDNEIGRELKASELVPKTVVVVGRVDRPMMITTWVSAVGVDYVTFYQGETRTTLIVRRLPDDTLADDTGARILVFE